MTCSSTAESEMVGEPFAIGMLRAQTDLGAAADQRRIRLRDVQRERPALGLVASLELALPEFRGVAARPAPVASSSAIADQSTPALP